jgi:hypothetical protein
MTAVLSLLKVTAINKSGIISDGLELNWLLKLLRDSRRQQVN